MKNNQRENLKKEEEEKRKDEDRINQQKNTGIVNIIDNPVFCYYCKRPLDKKMNTIKIPRAEGKLRYNLQFSKCTKCGKIYIDHYDAVKCKKYFEGFDISFCYLPKIQYCRFKNTKTGFCDFLNLKRICKHLSVKKCKYFSIRCGDNKNIAQAISGQKKQKDEQYKEELPKDKVIDWTRQIQELHIYKTHNSCKIHKHECTDHVAKVLDIYNTNVYTINVFFCKKCRKYWASKYQIDSLPVIPKVKFICSELDGSGFREKSELRMYGYSVAENGPSESERRELLSYLIDNKIMSASSIISHFTGLLSFHKNDDRWFWASREMKKDLKFVSSYKPNKPDVVLKINCLKKM